ncbi:hypothetical protein [Trichococcus flocculiformis]|uniref:hypothetical protein n=1 Tax=Trichococcus flocculiformis TaxID=82803 RepID=UPI003DA2E6B6
MSIESRKSQLKGYLLEIALSNLVGKSGFHNIESENGKDIILKNGSLYIRGRGGNHQCDTLGELEHNIPFAVSQRLFLEAKFKKSKTSIDVVRNGIGLIGDINQNMVTVDMETSDLYMKNYHYLYAIFSTSGFTEDAIKMALAYNIFLVDLGGDIYSELREAISDAVEKVYFERDNLSSAQLSDYKKQYRNALLHNRNPELNEYNQGIEELVYRTRKFPNLLFAYNGSSNTILLKPEKEDSFISYIKESPNHKMEIYWKDVDGLRQEWSIEPVNRNFGYYKLNFTLPKALANIIFNPDSPDGISKRAIDIKNRVFNQISLFVTDEQGQQHYVTLKYGH